MDDPPAQPAVVDLDEALARIAVAGGGVVRMADPHEPAAVVVVVADLVAVGCDDAGELAVPGVAVPPRRIDRGHGNGPPVGVAMRRPRRVGGRREAQATQRLRHTGAGRGERGGHVPTPAVAGRRGWPTGAASSMASKALRTRASSASKLVPRLTMTARRRGKDLDEHESVDAFD